MRPRLSGREKLVLAIRLSCIAPFNILLYSLRSLFVSINRGLPIRQFLVCSILKVILRNFKAREIQYMSSPTRDTYAQWINRMIQRAIKENIEQVTGRIEYDVESLSDGRSSLMWVGNRHKARKVVLFLHGGGYVAPLLPGHLEWCWRAYVSAGIETGVETAVAVLEYTLCPEVKQPHQLRQAADGLSHLLKAGFQPSDILFGGDSAGGNLAAQLLCHICKPHPNVTPIERTSQFAGTFLVSAWLTARTSDVSFRENSAIDMLSAETVDISTQHLVGYVNPSDDTQLAFPLSGSDDSYLKMLHLATNRIYITTGKQEVFRDQDVHLATRIRECNSMVEMRLDIQNTAAHDFILLEGQEARDGQCMAAMKQWMMGILREHVK